MNYFIVTYYLDTDDALPCQTLMTQEQLDQMPKHHVVKFEPLEEDSKDEKKL